MAYGAGGRRIQFDSLTIMSSLLHAPRKQHRDSDSRLVGPRSRSGSSDVNKDLTLPAVETNGNSEVGEGPGPRVPDTCSCMYRNCLSPYIVDVVYFTHVGYFYLTPTTRTVKKELKKIDKSLYRGHNNFLNVLHKIILLKADCVLFGHIIASSLNIVSSLH
jgi:hypothetical protein